MVVETGPGAPPASPTASATVTGLMSPQARRVAARREASGDDESADGLVSLWYEVDPEDNRSGATGRRTLAGNVQGIRIVYLSRVVEELIVYFDSPPIMALKRLLRLRAPNVVRLESVLETDTDNDDTPFPLTELDITLTDLQLIIPRSSTSSQHARACISQLRVVMGPHFKDGAQNTTNHTTDTALTHDSRRCTVTIDDIVMATHLDTHSLDAHLLQTGAPSHITVNLLPRRALHILVCPGPLEATISASQVQLVVAILSENLSEPPLVLSAEFEERGRSSSDLGFARSPLRSLVRNASGQLKRRKRHVSIQVAVPTLSATLVKESDTARGFVEFRLIDLGAIVTLAPGEASTVEITLPSIALVDSDADLDGEECFGEVRELLQFSVATDSPSNLHSRPGTVSIDVGSEEVSVEVIADGLRFAFSPALLDLADYLAAIAQATDPSAVPTSSSTADNLNTPPVTPPRPNRRSLDSLARSLSSAVASPTTASKPVRVLLQLPNVRVRLVGDLASPDAEGEAKGDVRQELLLTLSLQCRLCLAEGITANTQLYQLQLEQTVDGGSQGSKQPSSRGGGSALLVDLPALALTVTRRPSRLIAGGMLLEVLLDTDELDLNFAYENITLSLAVLDRLTKAVVARTRPKSLLSEASATSFDELWIVLAVGRASLTLVNDCHSMSIPMARFEVVDARATVAAVGNLRVFGAHSALSIDYFNNAIVEWEPLLEPWRVRADLRQYLTAVQTVPTNELRLTSEKELCVNVTHSMLTCLSDMTSRLLAAGSGADVEDTMNEDHMDEDHPKTKAIDEEGQHASMGSTTGPEAAEGFSLYWVHNETEMDLCMRFTGLTPTLSAGAVLSKPNLVVPAFSKRPLDFPPHLSSSRHYLAMALRQDMGWPSMHVFAARQAAKVFQMPILGGHVRSEVPVVVRTEVENGVKVLRIHSCIGLHNVTRATLQATLVQRGTMANDNINRSRSSKSKSESKNNNPMAEIGLLKDTLRPNDRVWLPLLCPITSACVQLRPTALEPHLFRTSDLIDVHHPPHRSYNNVQHLCDAIPTPDARRSPPGFTFTVSAQRAMGDLFTVYRILPTLIIENLLPLEVAVRWVEVPVVQGRADVSDVDLNTAIHAIAPAGAETPVNGPTLSPSNRAFLSFSFATLTAGWTEQTPVDIERAIRHEQRGVPAVQSALAVEDKEGRIVHVHLAASMHCGCLRVVLFVPFWLYDLTGLGLCFSRDRRSTPCDLLERAREKSGDQLPLLFSFPDSDQTKRLFVTTSQKGHTHTHTRTRSTLSP
jgi:hypothetical protein